MSHVRTSAGRSLRPALPCRPGPTSRPGASDPGPWAPVRRSIAPRASQVEFYRLLIVVFTLLVASGMAGVLASLLLMP